MVDTIPEYKAISDCRKAGALTYTLDGIIWVKAVILVYCTLQGIKWWRRTEATHFWISFMLYASILVVSLPL